MLDGIENVNLIKGELIVTTDADELDLRTGGYYAMATCEASTISDSEPFTFTIDTSEDTCTCKIYG